MNSISGTVRPLCSLVLLVFFVVFAAPERARSQAIFSGQFDGAAPSCENSNAGFWLFQPLVPLNILDGSQCLDLSHTLTGTRHRSRRGLLKIKPTQGAPTRKKRKNRTDQPSEAEQFYIAKRRPADSTRVPTQRYEIARQQMQRMPRFSSRQSAVLPSLVEAAALPPVELAQALDTWVPLGPGNVGGRTRALLIHPTTPNTMWAAGVSGGVWKTTDGGANWIPLQDMMANLAVSSMAMQPGNANVIYAGTGEGFFNFDAVRGNGIFKTTDGGATWTQLAATANNPHFHAVNDIVVSPNNVNRVYAGTGTGVWRSLDAGATWTPVHNPAVAGGCLDLAIRTDVGPNDTVFVSCGNFSPASIFRNSNANGAGTWDEVLADGPNMGRTSLALAPSNQNTIYALASNIDGTSELFLGLHKVFRSTSGGDSGSWTTQVSSTSPVELNRLLLTNPVFAFTGCPFGQSFSSQGWYDNVIAVDPLDPNRVWAGGIDLFRSDNGGMDWGQASHWWISQASSRYAHADQHVIVFHPNYDGTPNKTMFVGNDGGLFRTTDARAATGNNPCSATSGSVPWTNLNNNYAVTQFYHGLPYPNGTTYFGGTQDNGTIRGTDAAGTEGWVEIQGGDGGYVAVDPTNTQVLYAETTFGDISKSTDGGVNFDPATNGISDPGFLFIAPFIMDTSEPETLWTGGSQMWRTMNAAGIWEEASDILGTGSVSSLAVAPSDRNRVLAGTDVGDIHRQTAALTADGTTTWASATPRAGFVSSLAFDPTDANIAYATYSSFNSGPDVGHVWKSTNGGATWTNIDGSGPTGIPDIPAHSIVVDPADTNRLYVGTDLGVFTSIDGGATWMVENTGFANVVTEAMAIASRAGVTNLFAFTHGRGAWRVRLETSPNPDFSLAISNPTQTVFPGATATFNGTLTAIDGYNSSVTITCQPGHTGVPGTCNGTTATPSPGGQAFSVTASSASAQDFAFNIRGVGSDPANTTHTQAVTLNVVDFNLTDPIPNAVTVVKGNTSSAMVFQVQAQGSFSGAVTLDCEGLPAGANCHFAPSNLVTPTAGSPAVVSLTVSTEVTTPDFDDPITIVANSSAPAGERTETFNLTVTSPVTSSDLSVDVSHSFTGGRINFGVAANFSVLAANAGPDPASNVVVSLNFTGARLKTSALGCSAPVGNTISCSVAALANGANANLAFSFEAAVAGGIRVNASVTSSSADPANGNNSDGAFVQAGHRPRLVRPGN